VLLVESTAPLGAGDSYQVVSRLSVADAQSLRAVDEGADPGWVRERYLPLPPAVPERVLAKSAELTQAAATRYDKAVAIKDYLRGFPYSETIGEPPAGQDRVDWFLFDEQRGYCDYYSSSFVVLARAAGIPARVAAGYSRGNYVAEVGAYRQHAFDAHTWPEVYFPDYGWQAFEPTAGDPDLLRPETMAEGGAEEAPAGAPDELQRDELLPEEDLRGPQELGDDRAAAAARGLRLDLALAGRLAVALGLLAAMAAAGHLAWQRPLRGLSAAEAMYARLTRVASWLGLRPRAGDTPYEYGARIAGAIPHSEPEISTITEAYVRERFGRREGDAADTLEAAWLRLRRGLARGAARLGLGRIRRG
jgi:hypothetical protein